MHSAAQSGNALLVRWLLENTSREQIHKRNIHGQTPLYYAIDAGQIEIVALFCIFGANISERDYFWDTPLEHALKIIERIRKDKEIEPGNKQHPSRLLQELTMIDIISWLKERACQQHRIDESPIDYSASRKALCLPPNRLKKKHLTDRKIASNFYLTACQAIIRYFYLYSPESVLAEYFKANRCTLVTRANEKRMPRQFMSHVLSTILLLNLNRTSQTYFVLSTLLNTRIDDTNFSGALKYFSDRWIEFLLVVKAREHFKGQHPDSFVAKQTTKRKSFPWLSTVAIDQLKSKNNSGELSPKKTAAQTSLKRARENVKSYMTTFSSRLAKEQEKRVDSVLDRGNESLKNKCWRALMRDAMPPPLHQLPDALDPESTLATNNDKWHLFFNTQQASSQEATPLIEVGTSDGQITEFIPVQHC